MNYKDLAVTMARAQAEQYIPRPVAAECAHEWVHAGAGYDGEEADEEGRCYCIYCGEDGDG